MKREALISVNGSKLAAYSIGKGPTVIFLHGGPGDTHHYMRRMAGPLLTDFQCIFFDQRGTGGSIVGQRQRDQFTLDLLLEDVIAVQNHFACEPAALVGHSWGANYALFSCMRYPDRFTKVALLNMGPLTSEIGQETARHLLSVFTPTEQERWRHLRAERNSARDRDDLIGVRVLDREMMHLRVKAWVFNPALRDAFLDEYFRDPPPDREINKWIWESAENRFSWEDLEQIKARIWICAGADDAVPVAQARKVSESRARPKLTVIEKCGHIPWLEHPDLFYTNLRDFLHE